IQNNGTSGSVNWAISPSDSTMAVPVKFTSMPVSIPQADPANVNNHVIMIGTDNGKLRQVNFDNGSQQGTVTVVAGATVYDPAVDILSGGNLINSVNVIIGGASAKIAQYCAPL